MQEAKIKTMYCEKRTFQAVRESLCKYSCFLLNFYLDFRVWKSTIVVVHILTIRRSSILMYSLFNVRPSVFIIAYQLKKKNFTVQYLHSCERRGLVFIETNKIGYTSGDKWSFWWSNLQKRPTNWNILLTQIEPVADFMIKSK